MARASRSAIRRRNGRAGQRNNAGGATGGMKMQDKPRAPVQTQAWQQDHGRRPLNRNRTSISKSGELRSGSTGISESPCGSDGRRG